MNTFLARVCVSIRAFSVRHFAEFNRFDFLPIEAIRSGLTLFFSWSLPTAFLVYASTKWASLGYFQYVETAIPEGLGPHLWNITGSLAAIVFGLALLLPRCLRIAWLAKYLFQNTFVAGSLMLGILIGQLLALSFPGAWGLLERTFAGLFASFLTVVVFFLNFLLWYLASLLPEKTRLVSACVSDDALQHGVSSHQIMHKWRRVTWRIRVPIAIVVMVLPIIFTLSATAPKPLDSCVHESAGR